jgi:hypothetical protein
MSIQNRLYIHTYIYIYIERERERIYLLVPRLTHGSVGERRRRRDRHGAPGAEAGQLLRHGGEALGALEARRQRR